MPSSDLAPYTNVFRAGDSHRVRRSRQPVSCISCQRRKARCDRQKPCGSCEKRGDGATCRFGSVTQAAASAAAAAAGAGEGAGDVQAKMARLEAMVRDLAPQGMEAQRGEGESERRFAPDGGEGVDLSYHGTTSWAAVMDSIHDIQGILQESAGEPSLAEPPPPPPPPQEPDTVLGDISPVTIKDVVASMPSRLDADKLVQTYFGAKFLSVPFIHAHHFRRRYEAFWANPEEASTLWIAIMLSILSIGAMVAKVKGLVGLWLTTVAEPQFYLRLAARCLVTGQYLQAKRYSVEALMMFAHSRNIQKQDSDSTIWSLYSLAVRLAQRRGYHLDAAKVSASITPFEAEMRRRTWFMVQTCDLLFSFQLGLPPSIYQDVCDVDHLRNLTDDDFDEDTDVPESRPPTDPGPMLAWRVKSHLCRILRRVLCHALAVVPPPYEDVVALSDELARYYASVPPCLRIRTIRSTAFADEGHIIMHRLILELMYRKTLCLLHRKYLSVHKDDPRYNASREISRDAAVRILNLHHEFDREIRPGGRMYEDRFMVSNLTLHDFLIAAMVLCLDLCESADISPDDRAYRIRLLQTTHSIWASRSTASHDALHASRVLRAILNRVDPPAVSASSSGTTLVGDTPDLNEWYPGPTASGEYMPMEVTPMQYGDFPVSFDEAPPLENFFGGETLDWSSFDSYLRMGFEEDGPWSQSFQDNLPGST